MSAIETYLTQREHRELADEYRALDSNEDKLTWLMERPSHHKPVPAAGLTDDRKVPGCLSGLWLNGESLSGACFFAAKSESDMVQGIASFICDLYSNRPAHEVLAIGDSLTQVLGLERLLSTTRKRAVSSTISFIQHTARNALGIEVAA